MPSPVQVAEITARKRLDGVEFTIKSEPLERLFRTLSEGRTTSVDRPCPSRPRARRRDEDSPRPGSDESSETPPVAYTGATHRYSLDLIENGIPAQLKGFTNGRFDLWGSPELVHTRGPRLNLSLLTAVGVGTEAGTTVYIPTVVSDKLLMEYTEGLKSAIRQLWIDYIGDRTHTIIITCEHTVA